LLPKCFFKSGGTDIFAVCLRTRAQAAFSNALKNKKSKKIIINIFCLSHCDGIGAGAHAFILVVVVVVVVIFGLFYVFIIFITTICLTL